jgi:biopolymer transport protein ExbD
MTTPDSRMSAEPNVTPMIDVLLVLLVMFFLIVPQIPRVLSVQLPDPSDVTRVAGPPIITVEARPGGRYALDGAVAGSADASLTLAALSSRLRARHASAPDAVLLVKGAEGVRYAEVFSALDVAKGAGVRFVALAPKVGGEGARK